MLMKHKMWRIQIIVCVFTSFLLSYTRGIEVFDEMFYLPYQIYYTNTVVNVYNLYAGREPLHVLWFSLHVSNILKKAIIIYYK